MDENSLQFMLRQIEQKLIISHSFSLLNSKENKKGNPEGNQNELYKSKLINLSILLLTNI